MEVKKEIQIQENFRINRQKNRTELIRNFIRKLKKKIIEMLIIPTPKYSNVKYVYICRIKVLEVLSPGSKQKINILSEMTVKTVYTELRYNEFSVIPNFFFHVSLHAIDPVSVSINPYHANTESD